MGIKRFDIKLGYKCNNNCICCPAAHQKNLGDQNFERIHKELLEGIKLGAQEVVLTGGEPSVRSDIVEIVALSRDLGYKYIQLQTNGRMLSYKSFCRKLIEAGVTEFGPSLHGPSAEIHDYLVQAPGAFDQVVKGIKNLKEMRQWVIINSVITKFNYKFLPETARLFVELGVDQYQFAFPHLVGNAWKNSDKICPKKSEIEPYLKRGLQVGIDAGITVMVEAYPFCFLKGYEKYSSDLFMPPSDSISAAGLSKNNHISRRVDGKRKHEKCGDCMFEILCEGPWKEYISKFGWAEFKPVNGKKFESKQELLDWFDQRALDE